MTAKINPLLTRSQQLSVSWKNRKNYIGYDKTAGSIYNTWRSIVYNRKGKKIGYPESWKNFNCFQTEIGSGWKRGMVLIRLDTKKPYSTDNVRWGDKGEETINSLIKLTYKGEEKTLLEWAKDLNVNYNGLRQRYFMGDGYTTEQILFGKFKRLSPIKFKDILDLSSQKAKDKTCCMWSAYKHRDKVRNRKFNLTQEFVRKSMASPCSYCGDTKNIGLDRINNNIGHTMDNCIPCCRTCNVARSNNFTYEEMLKLGKTIASIKENRLNEDNNRNS
jgi:hypothetical protein